MLEEFLVINPFGTLKDFLVSHLTAAIEDRPFLEAVLKNRHIMRDGHVMKELSDVAADVVLNGSRIDVFSEPFYLEGLLAENPRTSVETLRRLSELDSDYVDLKLASNSHITSEIIDKLIRKGGYEFTYSLFRNSAVIDYLMQYAKKNPALDGLWNKELSPEQEQMFLKEYLRVPSHKSEYDACCRALADRGWVPVPVLCALQRNGYSLTVNSRAGYLAVQEFGGWIFEAVGNELGDSQGCLFDCKYFSSEEEAREYMRHREDRYDEDCALSEMDCCKNVAFKDGYWERMAKFAANPGASPEQLDYIADLSLSSEDVGALDVLRKLASRTLDFNEPYKTRLMFRRLSEHPDIGIRRSLASNPVVPADILTRLSGDEDVVTAYYACNNPSAEFIGSDIAAKAAERMMSSSDNFGLAASYRYTPDAVFKCLVEKGGYEGPLLGNPGFPLVCLAGYLRHPNPEVVAGASVSPGLRHFMDIPVRDLEKMFGRMKGAHLKDGVTVKAGDGSDGRKKKFNRSI